MKRILLTTILSVLLVTPAFSAGTNKAIAEIQRVNSQQEQYATVQPVPFFDFSLERDKVIQLYQIRNSRVATHTVWRSEMGTIEGDCPSEGFGIPYGVSLTNPLQIGDAAHQVNIAVVEQAEPNGLFASKNTTATWVMCIGQGGSQEPHYVETKVTVYPYPVKVDYDRNRVTRAGEASVKINSRQ